MRKQVAQNKQISVKIYKKYKLPMSKWMKMYIMHNKSLKSRSDMLQYNHNSNGEANVDVKQLVLEKGGTIYEDQ